MNYNHVARDHYGNAIDPAVQKKENKVGAIIAIAVLAVFVLLIAIGWPHSAPSGTADAFHERKAGVNVSATSSSIAEAVKEHIRPVALAILPEGYSFVDDLCVASNQWNYSFEYWMLVEDTTGKEVSLTFTCPDTEDSKAMCQYITGGTSKLPELTATIAPPDAKANFYLSTR